MRAGALCGLLLVLAGLATAQQNVQWTLSADATTIPPGGKVLAKVTARIVPGWHLYSASSPAGIPATFHAGAAVDTLRVLQPAPKRAFDPNFNAPTETYEGEVAFLLDIGLKKDLPSGATPLDINIRFQTCNDSQCVPGKWTGSTGLTIDPKAAAIAVAIPAGYSEAVAPAPAATPASVPSTQPQPQDQGWVLFLLAAFGFGLASIFTPCVFPMIPITMSYFLNRQSGARKDGLVQAAVFCLGIVVLFSGIGLALTAILGPVGVVQLGGSPWVNGFIALLFIGFALSLLGAFEITIPSAILTRLNQSSEKGGFGGSLLMGLTFSLSSFACVGPFVGTLLAASVSGGGLKPLLGMVTFATGLALPFFLLALFPSYLKKMPRSGGWLARVKVVMGFVILAASLKYLSAVDQTLAWNWITRERFLAAWIVLFAMAGLYLLGLIRLEGIKADEPVGLGRLLVGMAFVVFAISLAPGMTGGKLGDLDAYVPAGAEGAVQSAAAGGTGPVWLKDQYQAALDQAKREGKLLFVNFTGVACANCHWMEANMLPRPEVADALKGFVLVELYTDRTDAVSEANAKLEESRFQTVATPFYAILKPDESVVATFAGKTSDAKEFVAFLNKGASLTPAPPAGTESTSAASSVPRLKALDGSGPIDTKGKTVVLNFWATYCVPCIQEIPMFNRMHQELASRGVAVVGVAMDEEGAELVKPFLQKHPMNYPVALGSGDLGKQFGVEALPVTIVFDRSGKPIKQFTGLTKEADLKAVLP